MALNFLAKKQASKIKGENSYFDMNFPPLKQSTAPTREQGKGKEQQQQL